jgi:hypothetical protein
MIRLSECDQVRSFGNPLFLYEKKVVDCFVVRTSHQVPIEKEEEAAHPRLHAAFLRR